MPDRLYSIIVPVYNAEATLHRCVDSILAQTYRNFELILVDYGSRDSSADIIDQYASADTRVIAIHKFNGGVSSARNAGLDRATGDYVAFIDADDYIAFRYLSDYQRANSDLAIAGYSTFGYPIKGEIPEKFNITDREGKIELLESNFGRLLLRTPWAKIFRREIIEKNHLKFKNGIRIGEDTIFVLEFMECCNSISSVTSESYVYYMQDRMKDYKLTAKEYADSINLIERSLAKIGSKQELYNCIKTIRHIFKYIFESGLWYNGMNHAKRESRNWFRYKLWRYIPDEPFLKRIRVIGVMLLWPILYRKLINRNSQ